VSGAQSKVLRNSSRGVIGSLLSRFISYWNYIILLLFLAMRFLVYYYTKTNQMHQCIKFILFWNDTLHVSDGPFRPSSGVQDCTHSNRLFFKQTLLSAC